MFIFCEIHVFRLDSWMRRRFCHLQTTLDAILVVKSSKCLLIFLYHLMNLGFCFIFFANYPLFSIDYWHDLFLILFSSIPCVV